MTSFLQNQIHHSYYVSSRFSEQEGFIQRRINPIHTLEVDCSQETVPCPVGCMEKSDCSGGFPCSAMMIVLDQSMESVKLHNGCSCTCQTAVSNVHNSKSYETVINSIYHELNGDDWYTQTNWFVNDYSYCSFYGIYCDASYNLQFVVLQSNNLIGPYPSKTTQLTDIKGIDFENNIVTSTLPTNLADLQNLFGFAMNSNFLEGMYIHMFFVKYNNDESDICIYRPYPQCY